MVFAEQKGIREDMFLKDLFGIRKPKPAVQNRSEEPSEEEIPIETGGLYCRIYQDKDGLFRNSVFRFYDNAGKYDDGGVHTVHVAQRKPEDGYYPKKKWFNQYEQDDPPDGGRWKRTGNRIRFVIELPRGNIIYRGTIEKDGLTLDSHSEITGYKAENLHYEFIPFGKVPGWYDE